MRRTANSPDHRKDPPITRRYALWSIEGRRRLVAGGEDACVFTSKAQLAEAVEVWSVHDNDHLLHVAAGDRPLATRLHTGVANVAPCYT